MFRLQWTSSLFLWILVIALSCKTQVKSEEKQVVEKIEYRPTYDLNFLLGKFEPKQHPDFQEISTEHSDTPGRYMHRQAYEAFVKMYDQAKAEGIQLQIISAARNFDYQTGIWKRKWSGQTLLEGQHDATKIKSHQERAASIMKYSAMPGTSRHHWGTDVDINALNNAYFESSRGLKEFKWLEENARKFGFARPYSSKSNTGRTGYEEEKWHWSYLPLSETMTRDMSLLFQDSLLDGFEGSKVAEELQVKNNYILGIDSSCYTKEN